MYLYTALMNTPLTHGKPEKKHWLNQIIFYLMDFACRTLKVCIWLTHRLPQSSVYGNGNKINQPTICKLSNIKGKRSIMNAAKHLKHYNNELRIENSNNVSSVYVTNHLSKPFHQQKKRLLPLFKQAKNLEKKLTGELLTASIVCL